MPLVTENDKRRSDAEIACRSCGKNGEFALHEVREMNFGSKEVYSYLECVQCGSLQIQSVPADLTKHYPPTYIASGEAADPPPEYSTRAFLYKLLRRQRTEYLIRGVNPVGWATNRLRKDDLTPHLRALRACGALKTSRILDVGCGPGYLLQRLKEVGFRSVTGHDPFQQWTVPGIDVHTGRLEDLHGKFDLIVLNHSLEHTPDPLNVLIDLKNLSAPGGSLLLRIPVAGSAAWKQFGVHWYQIDAPRHLVIPSAKGLEQLAQRAGFEIFRVKYDSDERQFLCSEQYRQGVPLRDAYSYYYKPQHSLFTRSEVANAKARAQDVNRKHTGDQACFYLRFT